MISIYMIRTAFSVISAQLKQ